jgi:hypothetical protein
MDEINPADYALLGTIQVMPLWSDASQTFVAAPDWLASADTVTFDPRLVPLFKAATPTPVAQGAGYTLYPLDWTQVFKDTLRAMYSSEPVGATTSQEGGQITLVQSGIHTPVVAPAGCC